MKIIFAGDIVTGGDASKYGLRVESDVWKHAKLRIANLECPITDNKATVDKCTLYAPKFSAKELSKIGIDAVSLANNHIQDKGDKGIYDTFNSLKELGIGYFGSGESIKFARRPYWITESLCIFSYCDFGKDYLKQVNVASDIAPGVSPLRESVVLEDLAKLEDGKKAILYLHWGREHVWFPPRSDLSLARSLLKNEKVALIVGSHAHRLQGFLKNGKIKAYMCLGNFIFPNFYVAPPVQMVYPPEINKKHLAVTRNYHKVLYLTYKKWKADNRMSLAVEYDTVSGKSRIIPFCQHDERPTAKEVVGVKRYIVGCIVLFLSVLYTLPSSVYIMVEWISIFVNKTFRRVSYECFKMRQWKKKFNQILF